MEGPATAIYEHTSRSWHVTLAGEPRVHSTGRTLAQARERIRDAAALWYHLDDASDLYLVDDIVMPVDIKVLIQRAREEREKAQAAETIAVSTSRDAADRLVRELHLSLRDAADLLGLSHQRIQQILRQ